MNINDNIKNRSDLKSYFIKNAIPTESNFAELIESVINQREDGLVKLPGAPLSIEASGDASSQKKVINLYDDFVQENPDWVISLNPRQDPSKPETARAGYSVSDNAGNSHLFIDKATGKIGIGTINPGDELEVSGNMRILTDTNPLRFTSGWSNFPAQGVDHAEISNDTGTYKTLMIIGNRSNDAGIRRVSIWDRLEIHGNLAVVNGSGKLEMGQTTRQMIDLWRTHYGIGVQSGTQYFRTDKNFAWYRGGSHNDAELNAGGGAVQMVINGGNVGIGLANPLKQLHIQQGTIGAPLLNEARRPGIALTGQYPELSLFSRVGNANHGATIRMGSYNASTGDATKQWCIGTAGQNSRFLDIGFSSLNNGNPHNGIRNYQGKTVLSLLENGRVGIGTLEPTTDLEVNGETRNHGTTFSAGGQWWGRTGGDAAIVSDGANYKALMIVGADYGKGKSRWVRLWDYLTVHGTIDYESLSKLNVADNFTATIGCADFRIGFSGRHGKTGRALVDGSNTLHVNYGPDWKYTQVHGVVSHPSSKKLKENIERLTPDEVYHSLENLEPVKFSMKCDPDKNMQLGFIAEDVPAVLATRERDAIIPAHITAVLVGVVRDLEARIRQLETDH